MRMRKLTTPGQVHQLQGGREHATAEVATQLPVGLLLLRLRCQSTFSSQQRDARFKGGRFGSGGELITG